MSTDDSEAPRGAETENPQDVAHGVTNRPPGNGDLDQDAVDQGADKLEQAGGGH